MREFNQLPKVILLQEVWVLWALHYQRQLALKWRVHSEREVVAIIGDGGYQMTIQELGTIFQTKSAG